MIVRYTLRNIFRNKKRSLLTVIAIAAAAVFVGLAQSWINGMIDTYIENYVTFQTGNFRIASEEYIKRERFFPVEEAFFSQEDAKEKIEKVCSDCVVEERVRFSLLLSHKNNTVTAIGTALDLENNHFELKEKIIEGELKNEGVYLGWKLAKRLKVGVGDELLLATKTYNGGLNGIKLRIEGISRLQVSTYDKAHFFISLADGQKLMKMHDGITEIYLYTNSMPKDEKAIGELEQRLNNVLPAPLKAQSYITQLGDMYQMMVLGKQVYFIAEAVIMFIASFVIVNTMMMSVFERTRELGTLKALGITEHTLFASILLEGSLIGLVGGTLGAVVGAAMIGYLSIKGVNLEAAFADIDMPMVYVLKPSFKLSYALGGIVIATVVPALASLLPARMVTKISPVDAMKK